MVDDTFVVYARGQWFVRLPVQVLSEDETGVNVMLLENKMIGHASMLLKGTKFRSCRCHTVRRNEEGGVFRFNGERWEELEPLWPHINGPMLS